MESFLRPKSIIDPEPRKETIEQCEVNVNKFFSDNHFRDSVLSKLPDIYRPKNISINNCKIIKPDIIPFHIVQIGPGVFTESQEIIKISTDSSQLGHSVCVPIENTFCPLIILYNNEKDSIINHEAIHIYQTLKDSFYPFDSHLMNLDKQYLDPPVVISYILRTLGHEKAIEFAVKKPAVLLREEAETWWRIDKKLGIDSASYYLAYGMMSLSKFVCGIGDIKISPKSAEIDELIKIVTELIDFIGVKDYYCKRIVTLTNRQYKQNYSFSQWLTKFLCKKYNLNSNNLEEFIKISL